MADEARRVPSKPGISATLPAGGRLGLLLGAAFLMATSAIGPGFLTQTAHFTAAFGASFGCAILVSVLLDIGAQLNVWRVVVVSEQRAQQLANAVLPGLGHVLSALVVLGGMAFNIGNIAGAGLGLNALLDLPIHVGAVASATFAIGLFLSREMGKAVDRLAQIMGAVMIALTAYVMWKAHPPVAEALTRSVWPEITSDNRSAFFLAVMTIVGGTVGGYISFAGAHRLLDSGVSGPEGLETATRGSVTGVLVATLMRCALFLAALGVVSQGLQLDGANPAGSVFGHAAGHIGTRVFGAVMWAAAITSVTGSAYTSISFLRTIHFQIQRNQRLMLVLFVICSTVVFLVLGRPVKLLILAGAVNGLILPAALAILLVAAHRQSIVGPYRNPRWLTFAGTVVVLVMTYLAAATLVTEFPKLLAPNSAP